MDILEQLRFVVGQIKKLRIQHGLSQIELSVKADLSQSFLANLEKGKKQPSVLTIIRIAEALDISPQEFFPPKTDHRTKQQIKTQIINLLEYLL
jgi:transcriptional regulator with XRE-family HTH domain